MISFEGQTLAITGAAGGIAREVAKAFLAHGGRVSLSDLDVESLEAFARDVDPTLERVVFFRHDVTVSADAERFAAMTRERFGKIDHLLPQAGFFPAGMIKDITDEAWRQVHAINLDGVFFTVRAFIPMISQGGSIVTIASIAGIRGSSDHGHYASAKGAVLSLTRTLAAELAPGLRVNCVAPGPADTDMVIPLMQARGERIIAGTPLRRIARPDEVAGVILFLMSPLASFVTGETIHVNGGLYIAS